MRRLAKIENDFQECSGCGYCCLKAMCNVGIRMLGRSVDRCPYLFWSDRDGRYWCELVLTKKISLEVLTTGFGCTSNMNSWRKDVKNRG